MSDSNPNLGRRSFIRHSAISFGATVHEYIKHRDAPAPINPNVSNPEKTGWLRPPGAVSEELFLERCTGCGDCVEVCPHDAIQILPNNDSPAIFPEESPCQLCDNFPCIQACETDALLPVEGPQQVKMGTAKIITKICTVGNGCNACISKCPTGAMKMDFGMMRISIEESLCVGCGICQYICRTVNDRSAIRIVP